MSDEYLKWDDDRRIAMGFGQGQLRRDGEILWQERKGCGYAACMSYAEAEALAAAEPDHMWEIVLIGPLTTQVYRRIAPRRWILVRPDPHRYL